MCEELQEGHDTVNHIQRVSKNDNEKIKVESEP